MSQPLQPIIDFSEFDAKLDKLVNQQFEKPVVAITEEIATPPLRESLSPPPGWAGVLANFLYDSALRPVPEIAISTSLAVLAGICGKAYTTHTNSGLNQYVILVARSGVGKEAIHAGISSLIHCMRDTAPAISNFFVFADFASGQALTKTLAANSCFLNVSGEFGQKLKAMSTSANRPDSPMQGYRRIITNLYQKSGHNSMSGGIRYSDAEKNIDISGSVAYSMIGETTPGTFYESLTPSMMEDGFMSRFLVIEYGGDRPKANENQITELSQELIEWFKRLITHADMLNRGDKTQVVSCHPSANAILQNFSIECDSEINGSGDDESQRQMWNRAHLKALKLSALLAVADNPYFPLISLAHAHWAIDLIRRDISVFKKRLASGDIGNDDKAREAKLMEIATGYISKPLSRGYNIPDALHKAGIIPRKYIQQRTSSLSAFTTHKLGATAALEQTLRSLCDSGYLQRIEEGRTAERFGFLGKCYRVVSLN